MDLSAVPAPLAASRPRLSAPRAIAVAALTLAAALVAVWLQFWPMVDGFGVLATAALAWTAVDLWRGPSRVRSIVALAMCAVAAWRGWHFFREHQLLEAHQPAVVAAALCLGAVILVTLAAALRRPGPAQTLAFSFSLALALWVGNLAWLRFLPDRLVGQNDQIARVEDARYVDQNDGLGSRFAPDSSWVTVYPSNPRGYFDCRSLWGPRDVRLFQLHAQAPAQATAIPSNGPPATVRLQIDSLAAQADIWQVRAHLWRIPAIAGETYELRMRCRADAPRPMQLLWCDWKPPFGRVASLDAYELTTDWKELVWRFRAHRDAAQADLMMLLGQSANSVELADFSLTPLTGKLNMHAWTCRHAQHSRATLERYDAPSRSLRLWIRRARNHSDNRAEIAQGPLRLVGGAAYRLEFWGRADRSQTVNVAAYEAAPQWQALGLRQSVQFEPTWQAFQLPFTAERDSQDTTLGFLAGRKTGLLEISDVSLACDHPQANFLYPQYVVSAQANSLGYRDREHELEAAPGVVRIACLGDSHTMGQGVKTDDLFTVRLEQLLNQSGGENRRFEVLNFGHSGFDTAQELLVYRLHAAAYRPQVVLVCMTQNDDISWIEEAAQGIHVPPTAAEKLLAPLGELRRRRQTRPTRDFSVCVTALEKLHAECLQNGARLGVAIFQQRTDRLTAELYETVAPAMHALNVPVLNPAADLEQWANQHETTLDVHPIDGHPNDAAHAQFAERTTEFLRRELLEAPSVKGNDAAPE